MSKVLVFAALLISCVCSVASAQSSHAPNDATESFASVSADPNYETVGYAWDGAQNVTLGSPLPVARRANFWVTVAGAINVYDVGGTFVFPSRHWRGLARVSAERRWGETFAGAHVWHESVHWTSGYSDETSAQQPQLFLNAFGIHARHRVRVGSTSLDFAGLGRFIVYTCTEFASCVDAEFDPGHGAEAQLSFALSHAVSSVARPYVSLHGSLMGGSAGVATEIRLNTRVGVRLKTNVGDWSLYLGMQAGNGLGHTREVGFSGSLGMRFTPLFAE